LRPSRPDPRSSARPSKRGTDPTYPGTLRGPDRRVAPTPMILKFPDLNSLRLALITGGVPVAMSQAGAVAGFDQDQCWVETSATLGRSNQAELKKLGVTTPRSWAANLERTEVSCWAEILPLEHDRS